MTAREIITRTIGPHLADEGGGYSLYEADEVSAEILKELRSAGYEVVPAAKSET